MTTRKNELYFALEALEAKVMENWIRALPPNTASVLLVGDAIWVHRSLAPGVVMGAFTLAKTALGLDSLQASSADLSSERLACTWAFGPVRVTPRARATAVLFPPRGTKGTLAEFFPEGPRHAPIPEEWDPALGVGDYT